MQLECSAASTTGPTSSNCARKYVDMDMEQKSVLLCGGVAHHVRRVGGLDERQSDEVADGAEEVRVHELATRGLCLKGGERLGARIFLGDAGCHPLPLRSLGLCRGAASGGPVDMRDKKSVKDMQYEGLRGGQKASPERSFLSGSRSAKASVMR